MYTLKDEFWSSQCGTTGSVASQEHWDTGLIPGQAQQVKDPALLLLQLRPQLQIRSLALEIHMLRGGKKKEIK